MYCRWRSYPFLLLSSVKGRNEQKANLTLPRPAFNNENSGLIRLVCLSTIAVNISRLFGSCGERESACCRQPRIPAGLQAASKYVCHPARVLITALMPGFEAVQQCPRSTCPHPKASILDQRMQLKAMLQSTTAAFSTTVVFSSLSQNITVVITEALAQPTPSFVCLCVCVYLWACVC